MQYVYKFLAFQRYIVCKNIWIQGLRWKLFLLVGGGAAALVFMCALPCMYIVPSIIGVDLFYFYEIPFISLVMGVNFGVSLPAFLYIKNYIKKVANIALDNKCRSAEENKDVRIVKSK